MPALARNFHPTKEERLGVHISIYLQGEELPQVLNIHIVRRQVGLSEIGSGTGVVILRRDYVLRLYSNAKGKRDEDDCADGPARQARLSLTIQHG
jgi:hypothetical protein